MAKERVTVCLPAPAARDVHGAVAQAMAPWDYAREDVPGPDWEGQWDYWHIHGAGCEFRVVPGAEGDPRLIREPLDPRDQPRAVPPGLCDGGPRELLDFEAMRAPVAAEAARTWHAWHDFAAGYPAARPLGDFWRRFHADRAGYPAARVQRDHDDQPVIRALLAHPELRQRVGGDPVAHVGPDLAAFVERRVGEVLPTHALLTLDGRWLAGGGAEYNRFVSDYLDRLPPDALAVRVMYHG